jgi:uncharacterized protein YlxP (DUF503 family)
VGIIVGLCTVELFIAESQSLKDKRQVLLSLKDRLREKFNLSVAEVDGQDLWQKAVLGLACVSNEGRYVNQVCDEWNCCDDDMHTRVLKMARHLTLPTPARQDAPFCGQGRSKGRGERTFSASC